MSVIDITLTTGAISDNGERLEILDSTAWADRAKFGLFLVGSYTNTDGSTKVNVVGASGMHASEWGLSTAQDGRYTVKAYGFYTIDSITDPEVGDLGVNAVCKLFEYNGTDWIEVDEADYFEDAVAFGELEIPYLAYAYTFKNQLNLKYIAIVKGDVSRGTDQNNLYYKRTDLDYVSALITGAGYNWALGLFSNFYEILQNIEDIKTNHQIS